ncbi:MAG: PEP-CTERM sorting domain-containing protein [Planctomycetes bacterium]|nr:PEP-CTERM sorting domain-containing protein [Planctomycetota bacterium]
MFLAADGKMKAINYIIAAIFFGIVVPALGETTTISLPDVLGIYELDSVRSRTVSFDFARSFTEIQAVHIELVGTVQAGSAYEYFNPEIYHDIYGSLRSEMNPPGATGFGWTSTYPVVSPFDIEKTFTWVYYSGYSSGQSWSFLLDGQAEMTIDLNMQTPISWVPVTGPTYNITQAYLIVESVPEPSTILLLGLGGLVLRRKQWS